jgi:hypothetical protein
VIPLYIVLYTSWYFIFMSTSITEFEERNCSVAPRIIKIDNLLSLFQCERFITAYERTLSTAALLYIGPTFFTLFHYFELKSTAFADIDLTFFHFMTCPHVSPSFHILNQICTHSYVEFFCHRKNKYYFSSSVSLRVFTVVSISSLLIP